MSNNETPTEEPNQRAKKANNNKNRVLYFFIFINFKFLILKNIGLMLNPTNDDDAATREITPTNLKISEFK